jgi:hypothetical protein
VRTTVSKSPVGTTESSPGRESWVSICQRPVPEGRLKVTQDMVLGWLPRIANSYFRGRGTPGLHPGEFSAVPSGLVWRGLRTQDLRPGLLSAVPPGLNLEGVVLTQTL